MSEIKIPKKFPRGEDGHDTITIRMPTPLLEEIENISNKTGHSRNKVIVMLLSASIENVTITEK